MRATPLTIKQAADIMAKYRQGTMRRVRGLMAAPRQKLHQIGIKPGTVREMLKLGKDGTMAAGDGASSAAAAASISAPADGSSKAEAGESRAPIDGKDGKTKLPISARMVGALTPGGATKGVGLSGYGREGGDAARAGGRSLGPLSAPAPQLVYRGEEKGPRAPDEVRRVARESMEGPVRPGMVANFLSKVGALEDEGSLGPADKKQALPAVETVKRETAYGSFCPGAVSRFLEKKAAHGTGPDVVSSAAAPGAAEDLAHGGALGGTGRYLGGGLTGMGLARAVTWLGKSRIPEKLERRLGVLGLAGGLGVAELARRSQEKKQKTQAALRAALEEMEEERRARHMAEYLRELGVRARRLPPGAVHVGGVPMDQRTLESFRA